MKSRIFIALIVLVLNWKISNGQNWCIAKLGSPTTQVQYALDYACGPLGNIDCSKIQPGGGCYQPNTLMNHASFAFNTYFKKFKGSGATCDFNGVATLTDINPSYVGCPYD